MRLEFDNDDELFGITERVRGKILFEDPSRAGEFAVGLKTFGEVMPKNRGNPLIEELAPAFGEFMKKLKKR